MRRLITLFFLVFTLSGVAFAQQMSDDQVVQYVKSAQQMGKNQKYLAEKTGFSQLYISEILNGKHNPSIKAIYNISKVTGISIEELTKALLDEN